MTYSVGGTVSGLTGTLVLQDNGGDNLTVTANGSFAFPTQLASGAAYAVTVKTQPSGQTCTVSSGTGTVGSANITNVAVTCTTNPPVTYSVGGTVSGLTGTLVLQDNGGDNLTVTASGSFAFPTKLARRQRIRRDRPHPAVGPDLHGQQRHRHSRLGEHHKRRSDLHDQRRLGHADRLGRLQPG